MAALILYLAVLGQLVPAAVGIMTGGLSTPFRRWIALWCLTLMAGDTLSVMVSAVEGNNRWVNYVALPPASAVALWALSICHPKAWARTTIRWMIPVLIAAGVILTLTVEQLGSFSLIASPMRALIVLLMAAWTFVSLSLRETERLIRQDWFWIVGGIMLYSATTTALQPVSGFLEASDRNDLLTAAYVARAAVDLLGFLAVAGGMLCPVKPLPSGGSFSVRSSPSGPSSVPSAPQW